MVPFLMISGSLGEVAFDGCFGTIPSVDNYLPRQSEGGFFLGGGD